MNFTWLIGTIIVVGAVCAFFGFRSGQGTFSPIEMNGDGVASGAVGDESASRAGSLPAREQISTARDQIGEKPTAPPPINAYSNARTTAERVQFLDRSLPGLSEAEAEQVLRAAQLDGKREVRLEALRQMQSTVSLDVEKTTLADFLQDQDEEIRDLALHRVTELEVPDRVDVLQHAVDGGREDVAIEAIIRIGNATTRNGVDVLVSVMESPVSSARYNAAARSLLRISGIQFSSGTEARRWWQSHSPLMNDDLTLRSSP